MTYRALRTSHGFHSATMEPAVAPFRQAVSEVERHAPRIPFVSNVTGRFITDAEATDPSYWAHQIRNPVRFAHGIETLTKIAGAVWIEVGPGSALSGLIRQQTHGTTVVSTLDGDRPDRSAFLDVLSQLWVAGVQVNYHSLADHTGQRTVVLPTYPFETQNYWLNPPLFQTESDADSATAPGDSSTASDQPEVQQWLHLPRWREVPPRSLAPSALKAIEGDGWLIFDDDRGLGRQLEERLRQTSSRIVSVYPSDRFEQSGSDRFGVRPGTPADLVNVLQEGSASGWTPRRIVHVW